MSHMLNSVAAENVCGIYVESSYRTVDVCWLLEKRKADGDVVPVHAPRV